MPEWCTGYIDMNGHEDFRKAIANMMQKTWVKSPIDAKYIAVQAGCGAILDSLAWSLCDEGDSCITPGPIYPAFPNDFEARARVNFVSASTSASNDYIPTESDLEYSYQQCINQGSTPKILLLCHPCNPTGVIYPRQTLEMCITWSRSKNMHLVSDEIYGNSIFPGENLDSIAKVMYDKSWITNYGYGSKENLYMGEYVHVCAGFSKDLAINGFRVGTLFSHNKDLLEALSSVGYFQTVSTYTQFLLTRILEDEKWTFRWMNENKRRLKVCFDGLQDAMNAIGVPVTPCQGTMMAWVDFRKYLREPKDAAAEKELWL